MLNPSVTLGNLWTGEDGEESLFILALELLSFCFETAKRIKIATSIARGSLRGLSKKTSSHAFCQTYKPHKANADCFSPIDPDFCFLWAI